jgi:hypothetical protein
MRFGGVPVVGQKLGVEVVKVALLLIGGAVQVVVDVFNLLALRVGVIGEELCDGHAGRVGLDGGLLLLPRLPLLLFLCCSGFWGGSVGFRFGVGGVVIYRWVCGLAGLAGGRCIVDCACMLVLLLPSILGLLTVELLQLFFRSHFDS